MTAPSLPRVAAPDPESGGERDGLATRRPVGTFVALVALAALVLGGLRLTGGVAVWVDTPSWGDAITVTGERTWTVEVRNAGLAPVDVEAASWPSAGLEGAELLLGPRDHPGSPVSAAGTDTTPFAPFTLAGGESRMVMLRGRLACPPGVLTADVGLEALTVRVRSALGRRQSIDLGAGPYGAGPGGRSSPEPCWGTSPLPPPPGGGPFPPSPPGGGPGG